jgi:hypothetical protein
MNVTKVISELNASRKLLPLSIYHSCAEPSIQLSKSDFNPIIPFMKVLFKSFDRAGFSLHISRWGEVYLHSKETGTAILLKIIKQAPLPCKSQLMRLTTSGYFIYDFGKNKEEIVLQYRFANTKTKWRSISLKPSMIATEKDTVLFVVKSILDVSEWFQGRAVSIPEEVEKQSVTIDDIFAISKYCFANDIECYALQGIYRVLCEHYIRDYQLTDTGILLAASWSSSEFFFEWQRSDIKFLKKYLPCILKEQC